MQHQTAGGVDGHMTFVLKEETSHVFVQTADRVQRFTGFTGHLNTV